MRRAIVAMDAASIGPFTLTILTYFKLDIRLLNHEKSALRSLSPCDPSGRSGG